MYKIIAFLSRAHGYNVLCGILENSDYKLLKVYTHKLKPKSEDPLRSQRHDYQLFVKKCTEHGIPIQHIDSKLDQIEDVPNCDFIVEVSWRYLISSKITKKASIGSFGVHRGKLPEYAGAEPIKQALLNNEKEIIISSHYLKQEIDSGKTIVALRHPVNFDHNKTLEENIQRLRDEITPLYSKIVKSTIDKLSKDNKKN